METFRRSHLALGTAVVLSVRHAEGGLLDKRTLEAASQAVFQRVDRISVAMSAHHADSDLGRIASARPGAELRIDSLTMEVLKLSGAWQSISLGAFNPMAAGLHLARQGQRPGLSHQSHHTTQLWNCLEPLSEDRLKVLHPCNIDLGGIAKGFAVDHAIAVLEKFGIQNALINAGGDLRVLGVQSWPIQVLHANHTMTDSPRAWPARYRRGLKYNPALVPGSIKTIALSNLAMATSAGAKMNSEFVATRSGGLDIHSKLWSNCTVLAPSCVVADALAKWGLQEPQGSARFSRVLRQAQAHLWRSR